MARPLDDYEKKRDFGKTPEPKGAGADRKGPPVFVVHRHDASRLHYDLRIERDGALCSWAIPKGFSYDPDDKHLALRTEDHPLEYEDFHGVIPKGQYGAGTMTIWDRGTYAFAPLEGVDDQVAAGEVKLILFGRRLRGEWHLVRTKQGPNTWLMFKKRDRYAGTKRDSALGIELWDAPERALPRRLAPMEVGASRAPFSDPAFLFEARFEGRRLLARKQGDEVKLVGLAKRLPAVEDALRGIRAASGLLDGILVATDEHECPSRAALERCLSSRDEAQRARVVYYAFDLLHFEDYDLRGLPLVERKAGLRAILPPASGLLFMDHVVGGGLDLFEAVEAAGLPGVVAKRADSRYASGPSEDWVGIDAGGERAAQPVSSALAGRAKRSSKRVKFTNLDKVLWPETGFTKGDLIAYYDRVADALLPYLRDRPVHLNRYPDGIEGKSFYQKEIKEGSPDWIRTVVFPSKSREGGELEYMVCDDRETLLHLANLGSIELHPWMSRVDTPDSPDYSVIDLDPKEAPFTDVIRIARRVGEVLFAIGLRPLLKTSGKTGLHVVVPLVPGYAYEHSLLFAEGVARFVARELPDIATVERATRNREGKVYVDFGQNKKGQTIVPPYSVRPVRGATASCPLGWDELVDDLRPAQFTIQTVPARLETRGDLFRSLFDDPQELLPAIEALERLVRS